MNTWDSEPKFPAKRQVIWTLMLSGYTIHASKTKNNPPTQKTTTPPKQTNKQITTKLRNTFHAENWTNSLLPCSEAIFQESILNLLERFSKGWFCLESTSVLGVIEEPLFLHQRHWFRWEKTKLRSGEWGQWALVTFPPGNTGWVRWRHQNVSLGDSVAGLPPSFGCLNCLFSEPPLGIFSAGVREASPQRPAYLRVLC